MLSFSLNHIDMLISHADGSGDWRCTGIYGFPKLQNKSRTCALINRLADDVHIDKWLIFGDFNLILSQNETKGGNPVPQQHISMFRDTLQRNNLYDLGFDGDLCTWNNNQNGDDNI